jgi:hypothetical protein
MHRATILAIFIPAALAFAGDPPTIATDRPSVTDSSVVVPVGSFQFENGFADTAGIFDGPETLVRIGLLSKTEFRFAVPDYISDSASAFGDIAIGVKQQLGPVHGFDVSLVVTLGFPTGARTVASRGYDPSFNVPWSHALSSKWTAAGMLSVYWPTVDGRRNVTGESTFLLDRTLTGKWDAFIEYAGDFAKTGGPRHLAHIGTSYRPTPRQQFDVHFGVGLSSAAPHHLIGAGYSFRFDLPKR